MAKKKETPVTPIVPPVPPKVAELQNKIRETSTKVNDILVSAGLELAVIHQIRMNPDLRQEEIYHDIILKPVIKK